MFDRKMLLDLMDKGSLYRADDGLTETCGDGAYDPSQEEKYLSSVRKWTRTSASSWRMGSCASGQPVILGC